MPRLLLLVALSLVPGCASTPPPHTPSRQYLTSTPFAACDDAEITTACTPGFHPAMNLYPDGTATSGVASLNGPWSVNSTGDINVNGLTFRYSSEFQSYFHPLSETGRWGLHIVPTATLNTWWSRSEVRLGDPRVTLETLHYLLDHERGVHDSCLELITIGTMASVPHLVGALPSRATHPAGAGFPCTVAHCLEALRKLTGQDHGPFREDWPLTTAP